MGAALRLMTAGSSLFIAWSLATFILRVVTLDEADDGPALRAVVSTFERLSLTATMGGDTRFWRTSFLIIVSPDMKRRNSSLSLFSSSEERVTEIDMAERSDSSILGAGGAARGLKI